MGKVEDFKASGKAFGKATRHKKGSRTEDNDPEGNPAPGVLIPKLLDRPGPIGNLLNLIEDKNGGRALDFGLDAGGFPMGADPGGVLECGLIGAVEKG